MNSHVNPGPNRPSSQTQKGQQALDSTQMNQAQIKPSPTKTALPKPGNPLSSPSDGPTDAINKHHSQRTAFSKTVPVSYSFFVATLLSLILFLLFSNSIELRWIERQATQGIVQKSLLLHMTCSVSFFQFLVFFLMLLEVRVYIVLI